MRTKIILAATVAAVLSSCSERAQEPRQFVKPVTTTAAADIKPQPRLDRHQTDCIASAIWHEARGEPIEGQIAVAEVVVTRTHSRLWPAKPCDVVRQPHQFSFVKAGDIGTVPQEIAPQLRAFVADIVSGRLRSRVRGATHFHTASIASNWGKRLIGQIGGHLFFV